MRNEKKDDLMDVLLSSGWGKLLVGIGLGAFTFYMFGELSAIESGERVRKLTKIIGFLYRTGGVWGPVSIFGVCSVGLTVWGAKQLISGNE